MTIRNISCESLHHSEESKAYSICCLISWRICIFLSRNLFLERNLIIHKYMQSQDKIQKKRLYFCKKPIHRVLSDTNKIFVYVFFSTSSEDLSSYGRPILYFKFIRLCITMADTKSNNRIIWWNYRNIFCKYVREYWRWYRKNLCK